MKNIPVGEIKSKEDEDEVQVVHMLSSSSVPQNDDKNERHPNKDTYVPQDQIVAWAQDVYAPWPPT